MKKKMPSFFVVGAQKAGTTSLHTWLSQQPDICLPKNKETHFFTYKEYFKRGIEWYLKQFDISHEVQIKGEICPDYMYFPEAAERIKQACAGKLKIIIIFRQPIDRAYSHYLMTQRAGYEDLTFFDALNNEKQRLLDNGDFSFIHHSYMARAEYAKQIRNFTNILPEAEYLYLKFDDLVNESAIGLETYIQICEFIGIHSSPIQVNRNLRQNSASKPKSIWVRDALYHKNMIKKVVGLFLPYDVKVRLALCIDRLNQTEIKSHDEFEVPRDILLSAKKEINELQVLTGLDLSDWLRKEFHVR